MAPTTSKAGVVTGLGASWILRTNERMTRTIRTSATKTQRHEAKVVTAPPINGPTATATALAAAIIP